MIERFDRSRLTAVRAVMRDTYSIEFQRSNGSDLSLPYRPSHTVSYYAYPCQVLRARPGSRTNYHQAKDHLAVYPASHPEYTRWIGACEAIHLHIVPQALQDSAGRLLFPSRSDPCFDEEMKRAMRALFEECRGSNISARTKTDVLFSKVCERLRQFSKTGSSEIKIGRSSLTDIVSRINSPRVVGIRPGELAQQARVSQAYLSRRFRASFGCSPHEYILTQRVELAKNFLFQGGSSLADIALETGFYDQAHLARSFKQRTGMTLTQFRRHFDR